MQKLRGQLQEILIMEDSTNLFDGCCFSGSWGTFQHNMWEFIGTRVMFCPVITSPILFTNNVFSDGTESFSSCSEVCVFRKLSSVTTIFSQPRRFLSVSHGLKSISCRWYPRIFQHLCHQYQHLHDPMRISAYDFLTYAY